MDKGTIGISWHYECFNILQQKMPKSRGPCFYGRGVFLYMEAWIIVEHGLALKLELHRLQVYVYIIYIYTVIRVYDIHVLKQIDTDSTYLRCIYDVYVFLSW